MILVAAVLMQMCLGATYSWSVFVGPMKEMLNLDQGPAQFPMSIFYISFPVTVLFSGYLMRKFGPRKCAMIGGVLFGTGWIIASFGVQSYKLVVFGVGVFAGTGVGFAYLVPISTCIQWFPQRKGLVTGIAVAGFGGGAAVLSQVINYLIANVGLSPFETFRILGVSFILIVVSAGMFMRNPSGSQLRSLKPVPVKEVLGNRVFWVLYFGMVVGVAAGVGVNGNLRQLYQGEGVDGGSAGVIAVATFAIANALGRILWGMYSDGSNPRTVLRTNLIFQAVVLFAAAFMLRSALGLQVFAFLTGFNYGGVLVLYASSVAQVWGPDRVGQIYGYVFSSNAFSSLTPTLMGFGYDLLHSFIVPIAVVGVVLIIGAVYVHSAEFESRA